MVSNTVIQRKELGERVSETPQVETPTIKQVLDSVRKDSRRDAEQYLEESTVPHGGE
jgi:hypothetical protein